MEKRNIIPRIAKASAISTIYGNENVVLPDGDLSDLSDADDDPEVSIPSDGDTNCSSDSDSDDGRTVDTDARANESDRMYRWRRHIDQIPVKVPDNEFTSHDVRTPMEYFYEFLKPDMLQEIAFQTNHYAVLRRGSSINVTVDEIRKFIGISIYMGIIKFPQYRMYWSSEYRFPLIADVMGLTRYEMIKQYLHFNDNTQMPDKKDPSYDPLYKVRPIYDHIRSNCQQIENEVRNCIDEQMIKFKGRSHLKTYMPCKPIKYGFKIIARCGESGIIYDLHVCGDKFERTTSMGFCSDIVVHLCSSLPKDRTFMIYCDRYYTTFPLIDKLRDMNCYFVGTMNKNRLKGCPLVSDKDLQQRGDFDQLIDANSGIAVCKWNDRRPVIQVSNFCSSTPISTCKRFDKKEKKKTDIPCPQIVHEYNAHMGGVDKFDMLKGFYSLDRRSRKFYMRFIHYLFGVRVINGWLLYKRHFRDQDSGKPIDLLHFTAKIAEGLSKSEHTVPRRGRPSALEVSRVDEPQPYKKRIVSSLPGLDVRYDHMSHFPLFVDKKNRCRVCSNGYSEMYVHWTCEKCRVHLCLNNRNNCFKLFHVRNQ